MVHASRVISICLRSFELISASIVAGILGFALHQVDKANGNQNGRIVYTEVIAAISIVLSLILIPPLWYSFRAFLFDLALFICWITAFGLLVDLSGSDSCSSVWYYDYWGYYWGGYWRAWTPITITPTVISLAGCRDWRTTLAFSFISAMCWLSNGILGIYVCVRDQDMRRASSHKTHWWTKEKSPTDSDNARQDQAIPVV